MSDTFVGIGAPQKAASRSALPVRADILFVLFPMAGFCPSDTRFVLSAKSGIAHCLACFQERHSKSLVPLELRRHFRDPSVRAEMEIGSGLNARSPRRRCNVAK